MASPAATKLSHTNELHRRGGTKIRVDNLHYDVSERDLQVGQPACNCNLQDIDMRLRSSSSALAPWLKLDSSMIELIAAPGLPT